MIIYPTLFFLGVFSGYAIAILASSLKTSEHEEFKTLALRELIQTMHAIDSLADKPIDPSLKESLGEVKRKLNAACNRLDRY